MKNTSKFLGIIALVAVIGFSMAACDKDDDGGGGGVKPDTLDFNASYYEAVAKLDELIAYCNKNPSTINNSVLSQAVALKTSMTALQSSWSSSGMTTINSINSLIETAEGKSASGGGEDPVANTPTPIPGNDGNEETEW